MFVNMLFAFVHPLVLICELISVIFSKPGIQGRLCLFNLLGTVVISLKGALIAGLDPLLFYFLRCLSKLLVADVLVVDHF